MQSTVHYMRELTIYCCTGCVRIAYTGCVRIAYTECKQSVVGINIV